MDSGKSVNEWDKEWKTIGVLNSADLTPYNKCVGLYRHKLDNKVIYVGRATELNNGGLRKRLRDYTRNSDSARNTKSGRYIYDNRNQITTDILIIGDTEKDIKITKFLEHPFITRYNPSMND